MTIKNGEELTREIARLAEDKKGDNIVSIDLQGISLVADYFILISGNNERQVQAIVKGIKEGLGVQEISPARIEGEKDSRWVLMDYGEVIVHVFHREAREYYQLEKLWADAPQLELMS